MNQSKCNCRGNHIVNAYRANGHPVALWICPIHGNVFEDQKSDFVLTKFQKNVLELIKNAGEQSLTVDELSKRLNRTTATTQRTVDKLIAAGLI